jgi:RHS repeat-associated protein
VRFLTGAGTNVTDTYTYDAYGTLIAKTGTTLNHFLYAGEQFDEDLGQYYLRARYMNPETGRFLTMDSHEGNSEDPLSLQKFLYAHGNPVNLIDPSGYLSLTEQTKVTEIQQTMAAALFLTVGYATHSGHAVHKRYQAQTEYEQLASSLGSDVKVADAVSVHQSEAEVGSLPVTDERDGNRYFVHGGTTLDWLKQVRIKPSGRGEFGMGFYTFRASFAGFAWSGKRAISESKRGGFPFILVVRISDGDYESAMSSALDLRENTALWRQKVAELDDSGSSGHPVVIGPMSNKQNPPNQLKGPNQYKSENAG